MRWLNTILRWLVAVLVTVITASLVHSWVIQRGLTAMGIEISTGLRIRTAFNDFIGLAPALFVVFAAALAVAFIVAALLGPRLKFPAWLAYPLAGGASIAVTLVLMRWQMDLTPIASARQPLGFMLLCLAGAIGGLVFVASKRR